MESFVKVLDLIVSYGVPLVITVVFLCIVIDLYLALKKKWVPDFLRSFKDISVDVRGLNESLHTLTAQTPIIEKIHVNVQTLLELQKTA